ncbi:MAG: acyl-CoA dehydrogenase family protein [Myxococcales bacterium]|nr:acyl-CoA dehydrogenase family protein [Myxococcales bacterium]MDH3485140.1 acyl-CoA dehydrogenase family protein [Myxococcales bacterium]
MTGLPMLDVLMGDAGAERKRTLPEVWEAYGRERSSGASPFTAAVVVASRVDRLGFAFAVGYPAALEHMVDGVRLPCALCVTEANGNSPRAIETTLERKGDRYELSGTKTFVTFGNHAESLLVVARVGEKPDGRPDLVVVQIPASREGVVLQTLPETPFVPEVPHASVRLEGVDVLQSERLPGDGYLDYVKPFRTIEDIHVVGATLGYLVGLARRARAPTVLIAELSADLVALDRLRDGSPLDPRVHISLHGVYQRVTRFVAGEELARLLDGAPEDERDRWERDQPLLRVASKARAARFEAAKNLIRAQA